MKKIYKHPIGLLLIIIAIFFFTAKFDREYISVPPQEGEINSIKLESNTAYTESFSAARRSISQISLFLRPATLTPVTNSSIELKVMDEDKVLTTVQIKPSFINNNNPTQIPLATPITTKPGQVISLSLSVPTDLSGNYRIQLISPENQDQYLNTSFYIDGQKQERGFAFSLSYSYRPPFSYQLGMLLLFLSVLLLTNLSINSKPAIILYTITISALFISPSAILGSFSITLLVTFIIGFIGMFLFLRTLNLPLPAVLLGAHAYAFTTYFPLHHFAGRDKLLIFAFLPFLFLFFYHSSNNFKKHFKLSLLILFSILFLLIILPYQSAPVKPIDTVNLKGIFLDANQIPTSDKQHPAYNALQIPKGDPSVIDYYGGWDNFGSYLGYINISLAILGILLAFRKHLLLFLFGAVSLVISSSQFLTPFLSTYLPISPQYFIILVTFTLAVFAAIGLSFLWQFIGKDRLTNAIIMTLVIIALLDMLNVSSKTMQFGLL